MERYATLVEVTEVQNVEPVVANNSDNDQAIVCAISADTHYIISTDRHRLK